MTYRPTVCMISRFRGNERFIREVVSVARAIIDTKRVTLRHIKCCLRQIVFYNYYQIPQYSGVNLV